MVWLHSSAKVLSAVFCTAAFIWVAAIVGALEAVPFVVEPWKAALLCLYDDLVVPARMRGIGKERVSGKVCFFFVYVHN